MAGKRRRPVEQDEARRLLANGTSACTHCWPHTSLGIVDLRAWEIAVVEVGGQRT
ncbi:DUF6233 domain-containing protein [Streptomyces bungoensis]|uniref:DUF6233 domain-containing protein n=1 Tax=Streptomyces bungoensis TaxID=285568 RepID=UPI00343D1D18